MSIARILIAGLAGTGFLAAGGCAVGAVTDAGSDTTVAAVEAKARTVAESVGGTDGYGGTLMSDYLGHMPDHMGFTSLERLAPEGSVMTVNLRNDSDRDGTFHLSYFTGHLDLADQMMDVEVAAGAEQMVEIPCSEIVGMGPLDMPGEAGCDLSDGEVVDNTMAVPGFLGQDFTCAGTYECVLTPDVDDLDGDGDTEELIILSDAMTFHMQNGGPTGHRHGTGATMMGPHMGL